MRRTASRASRQQDAGAPVGAVVPGEDIARGAPADVPRLDAEPAPGDVTPPPREVAEATAPEVPDADPLWVDLPRRSADTASRSTGTGRHAIAPGGRHTAPVQVPPSAASGPDERTGARPTTAQGVLPTPLPWAAPPAAPVDRTPDVTPPAGAPDAPERPSGRPAAAVPPPPSHDPAERSPQRAADGRGSATEEPRTVPRRPSGQPVATGRHAAVEPRTVPARPGPTGRGDAVPAGGR
ncbi:hypothetical protein KDL28_20800, partial [Pseudonocardia sp. S2-4]|nr:hypothetical protein [Pseudonocardia humida]